MSDIFKGKSLIKKDNKSFSADTVLRDKQLICLYFAAQWCPPCRMFTPVLANVYKDARDDNLAIEVVFISADRNKQDMLNYMRSTHGDWYALPFDDPLHGSMLMDMFKGKTLLRKDGSQHAADEVLKETSVLALYFSAGWCPGCRMFTPVLAEAYRQNKSPNVEVVFVSSDRSIFAMIHFMRQSHANWFAVKFGDPLRHCGDCGAIFQ